MESDAAIPRRWSLEFLLRKSKIDSSNLIKKLIRRIPSDSRLKTAILLRTLEEGLSKASIAEWMLEILEVLEEMFRCDGSPITAAMSAAYCGVAVECTVKYLEVDVSHPSYLKAIKRIWRGRFHYMEPSTSTSTSSERSLLFSPELKRWRNEIEASVSDRSSVMYKLAAVNTRRAAINSLKIYLAEAWANYGPSFLEFAAEALHKSTGNLMYPTQKLGVGAPERQKSRGAAIGAGEMDPSITSSKIDSVSSHEVPKNGESIECSSSELQTLAKDPVSNSIDIVTSELAIKDMNQPLMENQSKDANILDPHACHSTDNNKANLNETTSDQSNVHRPGLTEPNSTARTHEWVDSIDGSPRGTSNHASRFNLPSPKRKKLSPLKSYEAIKITKRRKIKRWSQLEQETLKTAVSRFGKGNWKLILNSYKDIFEERTEVDLKDKWRNMMRYDDK